MGTHTKKAIKEALLTTQNDIIVRGASVAERLNITTQRLVGRITGGHITGLTATQVRTLLGIEAGATADLTGLEIVALLEALAANDRLDHGTGLTGLTDNDHTQYILHSLAGAANDFLVASGANTYVKKTLAETLALISPLTTRGDIMFKNATVNTRLAKGAENTVLKMGANDPAWGATLAGLTLTSPVINGEITTTGLTIPAFTLNGTLTVNNQVFDAGNVSVVYNTTEPGGGLVIRSTNDTAFGAQMFLIHISANPAAGDLLSYITTYGKDSAAESTDYCQIRHYIENPANGSEAGKMSWWNRVGAAMNECMRLSSAGILSAQASASATYADDDHPVGLFDKYDDALILREGISRGALTKLVDIGVMERTDTGCGYMMRIQPFNYLLAGGIYQNRARIDDLDARLNRLELALPQGG